MSFFARFISSSEEGAQAVDEPQHYLLPDGRSVFVTRDRERVLMYVSLEDISGGRRQHGNYLVEPVWLFNLAQQRGKVIGRYLIIPSTLYNEQTATAWDGFRMIPEAAERHRSHRGCDAGKFTDVPAPYPRDHRRRRGATEP